MALPATDTFTGTNGTPLATYSPNWTVNSGVFQIESNAVCHNSASASGLAHWDADVFDDDQYAEAVVSGVDTGSWMTGVAVRVHASADTGYYYQGSSSGSEIGKSVAGGRTTLLSGLAAWANTDVVRIEVEGTSIRAYIDGVQQGATQTDSAIASGSSGLCGFNDATLSLLTSWEGGNLGGAAGTLDQEGFRWYADTGVEGSNTALAAQDTNISRAPDQITRLRILLNATGNPDPINAQLEWEKVP